MGTHDSHPHLSAAERDSLTSRIALVDGVTFPQAQRQIEEFLGTDLRGPVPAGSQIHGTDEEETLTESATDERVPLGCAT
jgi:hypothetical protein